MPLFRPVVLIRVLLGVLLCAGTTIVATAEQPVAASAATQPTVLITGASRGIGFEFAQQLAARGWRVIATARNPAGAPDLLALARQNGNVKVEALDVTNPQQITALAGQYTGQPIDVLLLNAALGPSMPSAVAPLAKQNFDEAAQYFETNAIGPMRVAQAFMDSVRLSKRKQVIVISSDSGSFVAGSQLPILYHYKASKAALNMYFHTLAFEARKRDVTVVMLHPGAVATSEQTARLPGAMPTPDSVRQMLVVIDALSPADNGRFMDYRGEAMPW